ncbi:MAG: oligoribonuclease [Candidatus Nomurabacteria bacterium]|jgi:oligoribonuclease|nr:oligoribonuclease [Candidatus Nomurabacteria bacterium]
MKKASLLWIDLEMTGLDARTDKIIEVACIATDWKLREVASFQENIKWSKTLLEKKMTGEFWEKHAKTRADLIAASAKGADLASVEQDLLDFVAKNFARPSKNHPIYLAGNSVHQDRKFLEVEMSQFNALFHYRLLDVSALKIIFSHIYKMKIKKPNAHRAEDDIRGSIDELKQYLAKIDGATAGKLAKSGIRNA